MLPAHHRGDVRPVAPGVPYRAVDSRYRAGQVHRYREVMMPVVEDHRVTAASAGIETPRLLRRRPGGVAVAHDSTDDDRVNVTKLAGVDDGLRPLYRRVEEEILE